MFLDEQHRLVINAFRVTVESRMTEAISSVPVERDDRADGRLLISRWSMEAHVWYELLIQPHLQQVRAGIVTDDAWRSEDFRQLIDDSGYTPAEFVAAGFQKAGLVWSEPPIEHYRDQGGLFHFVTPVKLVPLDDATGDALADKVYKVLSGYRLAFSGDPAR